ncbi:MAG TPA: type II toxin-antitoxin system HicB family antitoxin [Acidimicrobiales bacterium]|nr:type II toxin-antitoxin system HicB family antitoxin [Acidimicrobiales bacterium]
MTAAIYEDEEGWFIAHCLEADVTTQGETFEEAKANIIEAVELHYEGESLEDIAPTPQIVPIDVNLQGLEPPAQRLTG